MKQLKRICLAGALTLATVSSLSARDLVAYNVGDSADQSITTPVALDVVNPAATTALRAAEALKIPAIFHGLANTNTMAAAFLDTFGGTRSNFLAALQDSFHQTTLDEATIASPDFGYLITAFNIKNRTFPVSDALAADWARGKPALALQNKILTSLQRLMQNHVRPDDLPLGLALGDNIRVIPANDPDSRDSISDIAQSGEVIPASSLIPLSNLKMTFRRGFSADEQPLARAASDFLTANCLPDHELTVLIRNHSVDQLVVSQHYNAGQLIVRSGGKIDTEIKLALNQLNDKLSADPTLQMAEAAMLAPPPTPPAAPAPVAAVTQMAPDDTATVATPSNSQKLPILPWLIVGILAAVSVIASIISFILARRRKPAPVSVAVTTPAPVALAKMTPSAPPMTQTELAPLVQAVKEAFIQELASQRRELIIAQQQAAAEITELVRRLDDLQTPMQERLRTYESEIRRLEKELAERTEENVELLKLKIQMTQDQLVAETVHNRAASASASIEGLLN
jgi:hypothetical protein